jgi:cytochrome c-type biogenesis protein CcmF
VHLGVALIAVGVISSQFYQQSREATLAVGASMNIGRYELTHLGVTEQRSPGARTVSAQLALSEDGGPAHPVAPARVFYESFNEQPATNIVIETRRLEDLYLVLTGWGEDGTISLVAYINPMVSLIWVGGLALLLGAVITLWPERSVVPRTVPARDLTIRRPVVEEAVASEA